jgi:hypothetical protein
MPYEAAYMCDSILLEVNMSRFLRLALCCSVAVLAGCASDVGTAPSAPSKARQDVRRTPTRPVRDGVPDSTGSCRAGYIVANGRCEPI